ncbi:MAG: pyridoxamine 5'-phosphate oxidase, partial [Coriobacteriales bacterium]|nr:pyridoxamine 5'-phosphate oxidase [Coriobacteriales bacterium]
AWAPGKAWLIVHGTAVFAEPSAELRQAGFEHMIGLGEEHRSANDGLLVFFCAQDALVRICDIDGSEERFNL